jgi:hypothetical protein
VTWLHNSDLLNQKMEIMAHATSMENTAKCQVPSSHLEAVPTKTKVVTLTPVDFEILNNFCIEHFLI